MDFIIEDGIPLPPTTKGRYTENPLKKTLETLQPGQSFWVPKIISGYLDYTRKLNPDKKFVSRLLVVDGVKGQRVWRTK